jgi:hypothetical protein
VAWEQFQSWLKQYQACDHHRCRVERFDQDGKHLRFVASPGLPAGGVGRGCRLLERPSVSVFWNLNIFDEKEFFVDNDFKRYTRRIYEYAP